MLRKRRGKVRKRVDKKQINKNFLTSVIAILTVVMLVVVWNGMAPFLIDNDNIYLKTIASGEMTGTPEPHMFHMGILSGKIIAALYGITGNGIPWFGLFLCFAMGMPMVMLLDASLKACKSKAASGMVYFTYVVVFCSFFYHYFASVQFTIATGMLGTAALLALALHTFEDHRGVFCGRILCFYVSAWLSFGMRDSAFLMLVPFAGMIFLYKLIRTKERTVILNIIKSGLVFAFGLVMIWGINFLAYGGEEWKTFGEYNKARATIFDYYGFPEYATHKDLYQELGITESSYHAITGHYNLILDSSVNRDSMVKLARVAKAEGAKRDLPLNEKIGAMIRKVVRRNFMDYTDRPMNVLVYLLYLFVFVLATLERKRWVYVQLLFLGIARSFDWFYLEWVARDPFRVTQIIYMAELVLLVAIILEHGLWEFNGIWKARGERKLVHPVFAIMIAGIIFSGIRFGAPVMRDVYQHITGVRKMSVCFKELENYLGKHPDNFYYFDMSHLYYMEDALSFVPAEYENYVYMGSWMPNSPWYREKLERFGITDPAEALLNNEHVFILYQQVDFDTRDFLDDYFEEHFPGTGLKVVEEFTSSNGFSYEVLKPVYKPVAEKECEALRAEIERLKGIAPKKD